MARGDWSVYGFVRAGIEARARLQRVEEERTQLRLHAQRLVHWIHRRLAVLQAVLNEPDSQRFGNNLKTIIIHHYRVIKSLLKADQKAGHAHLLPEDRAILLTSRRQIDELLNPEKLEEIAAEDDDNREIMEDLEDVEDVVNPELIDDDDDDVNLEMLEEELGRFIAERLQVEVDPDLVDRVDRYVAERIMEEVDEEMGIDGEEDDGMVLDD
jgi:uncharacterized membrane-anchored protein YjiN (DUF445 family)